eukprot:scaffold2584_cov141-Skeletonema_menzelii.AAC.7
MHQQPRLRGVAINTNNSEDQPALKVFDTSQDFHLIDRRDEVDSYFYEPEDESFAAATRSIRPLLEKCFRWHDSSACRNGGRSGFCIRGWTEKCINCKKGEEADSVTGECFRSSSGNGEKKIEHCFRWHDNEACRNGGRSGFCIRGWTEKCINCKKGEEADSVTGECVRSSSGDGEKKMEHCFRWHDSAACRNGGRSGFCIRGWTEKCIMCSQGKEADRLTGECVRNEMFLAEA